MDPNQMLNFNAAKCIQEADSIGHTTYTNICNGAVHVVQWGSLDWLEFLAAVTSISVLGLALLGFLLFIVMDL